MNAGLQKTVFACLGATLVLLLMAPLLSLFLGLSWAEWNAGLTHPMVWPSLKLSLLTSLASATFIFIFGTPLAWLLSQYRNVFSRFIESALQLPMVLPPAVAGVALLWTFGRRSLLYSLTGVSFSFSTLAVIMAQVFVSTPFFLQAALAAFRQMDEDMLWVARSFGASPFRIFLRLAVPLSKNGLAAGLAMCWARSLGEFGATLMFAGNLEGKTQTLPLAIYSALETEVNAAHALAAVLLIFAACVLVVFRILSRTQEAST